MSLLPRFNGEFTPLFRLLDDYASHNANRSFPSASGASSLRSFSPSFDVKESKESYELHGELPGIEQKDINIEFTDSSTLRISGHTEHRQSAGSPLAGFVEGEHQDQKKLEASYRKPSVEDADKPSGDNRVQKGQTKQQRSEEAGHRWWVTERSVGEFSRSFSFPSRVDQDAVKASLKNGVLTLVVPKAAAPKARKIAIE